MINIYICIIYLKLDHTQFHVVCGVTYIRSWLYIATTGYPNQLATTQQEGKRPDETPARQQTHRHETNKQT